MKKKHILKGRYSTYAKNNKLSYFTFCLIVFLWIQSAVIAQTTVFTDDFGSSHTSLTSGGSPLMTYTAGSSTSPAGICDISSGLFRLYANATPLTGREYFMGALSTFNAPFNSTLHSNAGLLTWTFNMRTNRTSAMNGFDAGTTTYGAAVILVSNVADPTNSGANGYAVVLGKNVNATNTVKLVSFTGGLTANSKLTTIIGPSSDLANYTSYVSVKVVYTPTTDTWQLYYRDDTTTASVDPSSGTLTQVGSDVINTTYTSTAMSNFGFFYNHGTAANTANIAIFDNFKVRINAPVTYTSGWPKAENANSSGFTAKTKTNVAGTTYFVVLPNGAAAPSSTQVKNGQNQVGTSVASNEKGTIASTTGGTEYVSAVSGLSGNTTYDVYFVSEDASGSNLQSSPTLISISTTAAATAPLISSPTSAGITNTTATLGGQITSDGGSVITERGTIWNSTTGVLISDNKLAEGSTSTGIFTHGRTSLPPKTLVYYKAYATNNIGTSLTSEASFYTLANEPTTQATALSVSATSPTSVNLSWTAAVGVDGYIILQRLGSSATTDTPTDANMYSVGTAIGTGTVVANITSGLTTSQIISGLTANTNYTYKIFTVNSDGINSQTYNYFTTAAPSKTYIPSIINISTTTLSGYNYVAGSGPSVSQSYSINGTGLTGYPGNISITGSTNYEVSTDNSTFSGSVNVAYSSATLSATTIYVRLKAGLTAGSYNSESISNVGGGAFTTNVTCNGTVASAPITYIWQGADLADWQVSTNWNPTRTTPASNDILYFNDASTKVITNVPTQTIAQFVVSNNTSVELQSTSASVLTIAGNTGVDFDIQVGSALKILQTTNTISIALSTGVTGSVAGSITYSNAAHTLISPDASGITFQNGAIFTAGTGFTGSAFGITNLSSIVFANGSKYITIAGGNPFGATAPNSVVVWQTGSTFVYRSTGAPALSNRTYANFEFDNTTGNSTLGSANPVTMDNLIITSGSWGLGVRAALTIHNNISVASGAALDINPTSAGTVQVTGAVNIAAGAKFTNNTYSSLSAVRFNINSDGTNGTGTYIDNGTSTIASAIVHQYLGIARNWYMSSPVTGASTLPTVDAGSLIFYSYPENDINQAAGVNGYAAGAVWNTISTGSMAFGTGYVVKPSNDASTVTFEGAGFNTGDKTISSLTYTTSNPKRGFNLIGNPYPSYLNVLSSITANANLEPTIWYKTRDNATPAHYYNETVNATSGVGTNASGTGRVTGYIPPMQGFWVRTIANNQSMTLLNSSRSHAKSDVLMAGYSNTPTTILKAPSLKLSTYTLLGLYVSNGITGDETILMFTSAASNGLDAYDSGKMNNYNTAIPEIFTTVSGQQLAINGMNSIPYNTEISLGYTTGQVGSNFSIKASQLSNFDVGTQVILKDYFDVNNPRSTDLSDGSSYSFTSDATSNNISRFTLTFKAPSVATRFNPEPNGSVRISTLNGQIIVNGTSYGAILDVFNVVGQKVISRNLNEKNVNRIDDLPAGSYLVKLTNEGKSITKKIIID